MGLIDRFQALFRPRGEQQEPATLVQPPARPTQVSLFAVDPARKVEINECRLMYRADPRARQIIKTLATDACKGGFELRIEGGQAQAAMAEALALVDRLGLFNRLDDWTRLSLRDGDSFLECGATAQGEIVHVSRKPTLEMHRWSDEFDEFYDPARAFFWYDQGIPVDWRNPPATATWFAEWQMVHARWDRDEGNRYGFPLLASARTPYKRMTQGELDIAIRRKTRAGVRYWHVLEDGGEGQLQAYMVRNREALHDQFAAVSDFFSAGKTQISQFQGDAQLGQIDDILHHVDTFAVASPVPMELIGYGRNINRDVLEQKKQQYEETLAGVRQWIEAELLRPLLERQWLLRGIWPAGLDWDVEWKSKKMPSARDLADLARAVVTLSAANVVSQETLLRMLASVVPDFDVQAELDALAAQMPDEIGRMDRDEREGDEGREEGGDE